MRLLHTTELKLRYFESGKIPPYAILSHCWGDEEVTFEDMQAGRGFSMAGGSKIEGCCAQAARDLWEYVWIDSCCINKSSSSELSEAIVSMFQYYQEAQVCYAYLADVPTITHDSRARDVAFQNSRWFTRGWTLQELLAPATVQFYDSEWQVIGSKSELKDLISSITGIRDVDKFKDECVAVKMSWASKRTTTRIEDRAYSLMGLFDVYMTPIYGEGMNAFYRLPLEILQKFNDESMFAWADSKATTAGLLAYSPDSFVNSGDIQQGHSTWTRGRYSMTNKGLCLELYLMSPEEARMHAPSAAYRETFLAILNCTRAGKPEILAIYLQRIGQCQFARVRAGTIVSLDISPPTEVFTATDVMWEYDNGSPLSGKTKFSPKPNITLFVKQHVTPIDQKPANPYRFTIKTTKLRQYGFQVNIDPTNSYITQNGGDSYWGGTYPNEQEVFLAPECGVAAMFFTHNTLGNFAVLLSVWDYTVSSALLVPDPNESFEASLRARMRSSYRLLLKMPRSGCQGPANINFGTLKSGREVVAKLSEQYNSTKNQAQKAYVVDFKIYESWGCIQAFGFGQIELDVADVQTVC